jgi:hypothetical protein
MNIQRYPILCTGRIENKRTLSRCRRCPLFNRRYPVYSSWRIDGECCCVADIIVIDKNIT